MLPLSCSRIVASSGSPRRRTMSRAIITIPEVQYPHCSAWCSRTAACMECMGVPGGARPSIVVTAALSSRPSPSFQLLDSRGRPFADASDAERVQLGRDFGSLGFECGHVGRVWHRIVAVAADQGF